MVDIFIVEEGRVKVTPQALLIQPFTKIWAKNSEQLALIKFGYIEFMCSHKKTNPFIGYTLEERPLKILHNLSPNSSEEDKESIMTDKYVIKGMEIYNELQFEASPSLRLHNSAEAVATKLSEFFDTLNIKEKNTRTGALLYKPADITRALKDVNDVIKTLAANKIKVIQELAEDAKGKGNREINYFERSKKDR